MRNVTFVVNNLLRLNMLLRASKYVPFGVRLVVLRRHLMSYGI